MDEYRRQKVLIFIVACNAQSHIESVLERLPTTIWNSINYYTEVIIIDDASQDRTTEISNLYKKEKNKDRLKIFRNPVNQGYGGNQKIGFHYALKQDFDIVALLHGDGQYAPELLPELIKPIIDGEADAVFGSRMINKLDALKGGMPLYKFIGNIILTKIQQLILDARLSEFHSGYRIYSTKALRRIPFQNNSNYFDFDTDIIIQLLDNGFRIKELPIPTYYGDEISHVNGMIYAKNVIKSTILSRLQQFQIYYNPKFDYSQDNSGYSAKFGFPSSHQFAFEHVDAGSTVIDIGCGPGYMAEKLKEKFCKVYGIDQYIHDKAKKYCYCTIQGDVDKIRLDVEINDEDIDVILLLDIIEHLNSPERFLLCIREYFSQFSPKVIITTGNISFFILRISLLIGSFNYGKKGILDLTHIRLFTFQSLKRLLENTGYVIERCDGIPVPFPLMFGRNWFSSLLLKINRLLIVFSKGIFAYQVAIIARPTFDLETLLEKAKGDSNRSLEVSSTSLSESVTDCN